MTEFAFMGANEIEIDEEQPPAPGPVLHLRIFSLMGGTDVKRGPKLTRAERREMRRSHRAGRRELRRAEATTCHAGLDRGVIPPWARSGFTDPEPRMPHVVGDRGRIAALVFGDPLTSPPRKTRNNKILWVARTPAHAPTNLRISARRYGPSGPVGHPVERVVEGGPGPSIVDLPKAGCWHLELHWSKSTDALDLRYQPRD